MKFELGQRVRLEESNERGTVIGRAEYKYNENAYLIRYATAEGVQVEAWWGESTLVAV